jgi:acetyltransferase-like isoleucine patch superfamily enzyme
VKIYDHNHRFNQHIEIKQQGFSNGSVIIGQHCWMGSNVMILKNTVIGDNCVIGAGTVVSGTIPSNSIVKAGYSLTVEPIKYID